MAVICSKFEPHKLHSSFSIVSLRLGQTFIAVFHFIFWLAIDVFLKPENTE
jgi:hypothetical protein